MTLPQVARDSPEVRMREMLGGYRITQMLYVAAKLGLPDLLAEGPKTAEELAIATNAHGSSLYRLLRALASTMLVFTGGRERTEPEYTKLLLGAGLRLNRAIPLKSSASVLEALPI